MILVILILEAIILTILCYIVYNLARILDEVQELIANITLKRKLYVKPRKRYVIMIAKGFEDGRELEEYLCESLLKVLGKRIEGMANIKVMWYNKTTGFAIVRVSHVLRDLLCLAVRLNRKYKGRKVEVHTVKTTGTVKKAHELIQEMLIC